MSEGLAQGPYEAAEVGFEPATFRMQGTKPTSEPPCPTNELECRSSSSNSFIQAISIVVLQVRYYSEELPTQHGHCAGVSRRSATGNCELRTCPRSPLGG